MNAKEAIVTCYRKSFTKQGRASRSEYWWFFLYTQCVTGALVLLSQDTKRSGHPSIMLVILMLLLQLFTFYNAIATIFAQVRRLHDTGRSGWWLGGSMLLSVITQGTFMVQFMAAARARAVPQYVEAVMHGQHPMLIVGFLALVALGITLLVFLVLPGTAGDNRYGGDPLGRDEVRQSGGQLAGGSR